MEDDLLIQAHSIKKKYKEVEALKDFSMELKSNQTIGLLGPNGAGKTTAIHMMMGILSPTSGELKVLGKDPVKYRNQISPLINFTSAYVQLPTNLTVMENLKVFSGIYEVKNYKEKIEELLELFDMVKFKDRPVGWLSAGEKTRVNLCKCFLNDPKLLLLDEPTSSLDPDMAERVRSILKKIQSERNLGMIYTSHNMDEVEEMCDEILFLYKGTIMVRGTAEELKAKYNFDDLEKIFIHLVRN